MPDQPKPTEQKTETKSTIDPFVQKIASSMQMAMKDDGELAPIEPAKLDSATASPGAVTKTLSDVALEKTEEEKKAETKKEDAKSTQPAAPATAPAAGATEPEKKTEPTEPPKPAAEAPKIKVEPPSSAELQRQLDELRQTSSQQKPPAATPEKPKEDPAPKEAEEKAYIDALTDEQKEELEFAKFAEKREHPGQFKKMLDYYRKVDKFATEHPDTTPESDEWRDFVKTNKPTFKNPNRLRSEMIEERAVSKAEEIIQKKTEELNKRTRLIELRPKIEEAVKSFESLFSNPETLPLEADVTPIQMDVAETARVMGRDAALKKYPVEAPIYLATLNNAREFLNIVNGVEEYNPQSNPAHQWIGGFINHQEQVAMRNNAKREGKTFKPISEFTKLSQAEQARHWTFNDADILNMMAIDAHYAANTELKRLEEAYGFKRASKVKTAPAKEEKKETTPAPAAKKAEEAPQPTPPKGGSSAMPGAAVSGGAPNPNASFLDSLVPGSSKLISA